MGGDGIDVESFRRFSSSGGHNNCRKDSSEFWVRRVGMVTIGIIPGGGRAVDRQRIHSEAACHHCGAHFQPAHI